MDINTGAEQELRYPAARLNENACSQVWGGDALTGDIGLWCNHWDIALRLVDAVNCEFHTKNLN